MRYRAILEGSMHGFGVSLAYRLTAGLLVLSRPDCERGLLARLALPARLQCRSRGAQPPGAL